MYLPGSFSNPVERVKMHGMVPAGTGHADDCETTQVGVAFIGVKGLNRLFSRWWQVIGKPLPVVGIRS